MTPNPDRQKLPEHIAIIMDGNSRWAHARGLPPKSGHRHGAEVVKQVVNDCVSRQIKYLTLFAFSTENWLRPKKEVLGLMSLFLMVLKHKEIRQLHNKNVRLLFIGNRQSFSEKLQASMREAEELTHDNTGTTVIVAADYGGRWDITEAVRRLSQQVAAGELKANQIDIEALNEQTALGEFPDPDLCIRTGGEHRMSNFLLWQFAYTEMYFSDCLWPEFKSDEFQAALENFSRRQRRFGMHTDAAAFTEMQRDCQTEHSTPLK